MYYSKIERVSYDMFKERASKHNGLLNIEKAGNLSSIKSRLRYACGSFCKPGRWYTIGPIEECADLYTRDGRLVGRAFRGYLGKGHYTLGRLEVFSWDAIAAQVADPVK